jgi:aryl-alcohol dehydrogenase-like predicted oxidoreductase
MYGLGAAEHEIGNFARAQREHIVIATKFGIDVRRAGRALGRVQGPVRRVFEARPGLRATARTRAGGPASGAGDLLYLYSGYDAAAARVSLERSLNAIKTDYVDLFLLHDPTVERLLVTDVAEYLERAKAEGLVRAWGIAGEPAAALDVARHLTVPPAVLQVRDDVFSRSLERIAPELSATPITFGSLGSATARIVAHLQQRPAVRERWRDLVGLDSGTPEVVAQLLIRHARRRNPDGITLFSTIHGERLAQISSAATSTSLDESLAVFLQLVESELAGCMPADDR